METIYSTKRRKAGMSRSEMATALGISHKQYKLIDRGAVKMPTRLIDKFNEIVNRGNEIHKLEALDNQREINDFFNEMSTKENNTYKLYDKMQSFNIDTYKQLAQILGYKNGSAISHYLAKPEETPSEFKHRLYMFFQDELNIQPPKSENTKRKYNKKITNDIQTGLLEWYNKFDFNTFLIENNLSQREFSDIAHIEKSSMSNYVMKKTKPSEKQLIKLKQGVDKVMNDKEIIENNQENTSNILIKGLTEVAKKYLEEDEVIERQIEAKDIPKINTNDETLVEKETQANCNLNVMEVTTICDGAEKHYEYNDEPVQMVSLSNKYSDIIAEINRELSYLENKIVELRNRREIYEEVLKDVSARGV